MISDPTVLFVNYLSVDNIRGAIAELADEFDVLVVSNSNSDAAEVSSLETESTRTRVVLAPGNVGFAGGLNIAVTALGGGSILIVNPDARLSGEQARTLVDLGSRHAVDVLSPAIVDAEDRVWFAGGAIDRRLLAVRHSDMGEPWDPSRARPGIAETDFVSGCLVLMSSRAVEKLFPLNDDLFMYWEDVEFSIDAVNAGLRLGVAPRVTAVHREGSSSSASPESGRTALFHYYQARNRVLVARRALRAGRLQILLATMLYLPRAVWGTRLDTRPVHSVLSVAIGTADGFRGLRGRSTRRVIR